MTQPQFDVGIQVNAAESAPLFFVCDAPFGGILSDRARVNAPFVVGRSSKCAMVISDSRMSKMHFKIDKHGDSYVVEDLNSTNHTWLNGEIVQRPTPVVSGSIIRAGDTVFCFENRSGMSIGPAPFNTYGIDGKFHLREIIGQLQEAAFSERHIVICGPSGSGKELAARALTQMYSEQYGSMHMVSHNAARFSSEEEAASTLFGIAPKAFTSVVARKGLIEQADCGVLFLDEIHNLPVRVQRSLLRVMEDAAFSRIGEMAAKQVNVRFIFASNEPGEFNGMAPDLYSRCRVIRIGGLNERRADIPNIFKQILLRYAGKHQLNGELIWQHVTSSHVEALCLNDFSSDNVRGIIDLCDRIVTRLKTTTDILWAVDSVFGERFAKSPVLSRTPDTPHSVSPDLQLSPYERHRSLITDAFRKCEGNFSAMERFLKKSGISCSRRWLKVYADKWGLKI